MCSRLIIFYLFFVYSSAFAFIRATRFSVSGCEENCAEAVKLIPHANIITKRILFFMLLL